MADTFTNTAASGAPLPHNGDQKDMHVQVITTSYTTGGIPVSAAAASLGLVQVDFVLSGATAGGKPTYAYQTGGNWFIKVFSAIGTEVVSTTNLGSADAITVLVVGR